MSDQSLLDFLVADLPPAFVIALHKGMRQVYKDAHKRATTDKGWGEAGARYMLGQFRHVLSNELLMNLAAEHRLGKQRQQTDNESADFTFVTAGRISMTIAHVPSAGCLPEKAKYREQYSEINQHLAQRSLFPAPSKPKKADLYCVISHGDADVVGDLGHLEFAFPDESYGKIAEHISVQDVIDAQVVKYQRQEDPQARVQKPAPVLKKAAEQADKKDKK